MGLRRGLLRVILLLCPLPPEERDTFDPKAMTDADPADSIARDDLLDFAAAFQPGPREGAWARDITVVIKTFQRPRCVVQLLKSIRRFFPTIGVLVCDDGRTPLFADRESPLPGVTWLTLPFELGHTSGAGRNYLADQVETPFLFLSDDDQVFTEGTRLDLMHAFLIRSGYDLVAGAPARGQYGTAIFEEVGGVLFQRHYRHRGPVEPGVVRCDRTSNLFLARAEVVRKVRWEERLNRGQHFEFFLRASRMGVKVAQMGYVWVDHRRECERPRGLLGHLLGRWLWHRDRRYRRHFLDGRGAGAETAYTLKELFRKHMLEKNGLTAQVDLMRRKDRRILEAEIGDPFYHRVKEPPLPQ